MRGQQKNFEKCMIRKTTLMVLIRLNANSFCHSKYKASSLLTRLTQILKKVSYSWEVVYTFLNLQVRLPNPFAAGFFEYGLYCDTVLILDCLLI